MIINFSNHKEVIAGISEKSDGSMVWWNRLPVDIKVKENRDRYFNKLNIDSGRVVVGGIAHITEVVEVSENHAGKYLLNSDALITNTNNLYLAISVADCMPVYFYDPKTKSIGMAHAGWKGLVAGVLENVVKNMQEKFGTNAEDLIVKVGTHIGSCCYEVGEDVAQKFDSKNIIKREGKLFAGLGVEAKMRLEKVGVKNIEISPECTFESEKFYSARRERRHTIEGMVAYIGLKLP